MLVGQPQLPDISLAVDDIEVVFDDDDDDVDEDEDEDPPLRSDTPIPSPSAFEIAFVRHAVSLAKGILLNFRYTQAAATIAPGPQLSDRIPDFLGNVSKSLLVKLSEYLPEDEFLSKGGDCNGARVIYLNYENLRILDELPGIANADGADAALIQQQLDMLLVFCGFTLAAELLEMINEKLPEEYRSTRIHLGRDLETEVLGGIIEGCAREPGSDTQDPRWIEFLCLLVPQGWKAWKPQPIDPT